MGKVAQVLIAGYWPDRVPRRHAVSQRPLAKTLGQAEKRAPDAPALVSADGRLSYAEFYALADRVAAGIAAEVPANASVSVLEKTERGELLGLVGGLLAGCRVAVLDPQHAELLASWDASAPAALLVASGGAAAAATTSVDELLARSADGGGRRNARWRDVAVRLPSGSTVVSHSHTTVAAMVTNLTTFIPLLKEVEFVCTSSLSTWFGFTGAMTALFSGRAVVLDPAAPATPWDPGTAWGILTREEADKIIAGGTPPPYLTQLRLLFVCMSSFEPSWRSHLEDRLQRVILPLWGAPEFGPAVGAHPQWAPLEMHGLPIVNVDLTPVDPVTGEPSDVPWEMLTKAELGIQSPSILVGEGEGGPPATVVKCRRGNPTVRTGEMVFVDRLGLVKFLGN
jgi:acyl-CoA synthetase (AMP-forming)/AMP-acid ligase II